jgi:ketosteroid isomerase-like protein
MLHRFFAAALLLLSIIIAAPISAQLPWADEWNRDREHARATAEAFQTVNREMGNWRDAWHSNQTSELNGFYTRDASITLPDGTRLVGSRQIPASLLDHFPAHGELQTGINEFSIGGTLAFSMGWFRYSAHRTGGELQQMQGTHVAVFRRVGRRWLIQHQAFLPGNQGVAASWPRSGGEG